MKTIAVLIFGLIAVLTGGCEKRTLFPNENDGMVIWTGSMAVDAGCDYMIEINSVQYKPINLSSEFQKDSLLVRVKYQLKGKKKVCQWGREAITMKITDIHKR